MKCFKFTGVGNQHKIKNIIYCFIHLKNYNNTMFIYKKIEQHYKR